MREYDELVKEAIKKAQDEAKQKEIKTTVVTKHENGTETITKFYRKGKAVWMNMKTGCIETNSRVYKVNSEKPYTRDCGRYWYLTGEFLEAMRNA